MKHFFRINQSILILLLVYGFSMPTYAQSSVNTEKDSLLQAIPEQAEDTFKVKAYMKLSQLLSYEDTDLSYKYSYKALVLSQKLNYLEGQKKLYYEVFTHHYHQSSPPDSLLKYIKPLEEITHKMGDSSYLSYVAGSYAIYYKRINNLEESLKNYLEALRVARKFNNKPIVEAILLHNIGLLFSSLGENKKCLKYLQESYSLIELEETKAMTLLDIGSTHYDIYKDIDTIQVFYDEALKIFEKYNNVYGLIRVKQLKSSYFEKKGQLQETLNLLLEAKVLLDNNNWGLLKIGIYSELSRICWRLDKYKEAIQYGEDVIQFSKDMDDYNYIDQAYKPVFQSYKALKNYKKALEVWEEYIEIKDTIGAKQYAKELANLESDFVIKEKEKENELLKAKQKNSQALSLALLAGLLFVTGVGFLLYKNGQQKVEYNQKLQTKNKELERIDETKTRFFANVAHELKTPLTMIQDPLRTVLKEETPEKNALYLRTAYNNSLQLSRLTSQILDLTKKDYTQIDIAPRVFELKNLVNYIKNTFEPIANYQNTQFTTPNLVDNIILKTDGDKVIIAISNLLNNAFKFTNAGQQVSFNVMSLDETIIVEVRDNGIGIPPEDIENIFTRYYKVATEKLEQNRSGMGLGLAIVKEYVQLIEGTIAVKSEYGKGTSFKMTFPKVLSNVPDNLKPLNFSDFYYKETNTTPIVNTLDKIDKQFSILIAEDNIEVINYLSSLLENDFIIKKAYNGKKALQILEEEHIDLIISDIMMPKMNGIDLLEHVKKSNKWRHIPFIILTALDGEEQRLKALKIGVDDYLTKPFNSEQLLTRVELLLENYYNRISNTFDNVQESNIEEGVIISNRDSELILRIETIIKLNISNVQFNMRQLADELNMSYSHLFPTIKRVTGLTPNQYFNEVRFSEARRFMEIKQYDSVKAVAYNIGFKDVKYFSKQFKKRFGKYPNEYLE